MDYLNKISNAVLRCCYITQVVITRLIVLQNTGDRFYTNWVWVLQNTINCVKSGLSLVYLTLALTSFYHMCHPFVRPSVRLPVRRWLVWSITCRSSYFHHQVASNCTSVATHGEFLVMTTHSPHACRFIRHSDPIRGEYALKVVPSACGDWDWTEDVRQIVCVAYTHNCVAVR